MSFRGWGKMASNLEGFGPAKMCSVMRELGMEKGQKGRSPGVKLFKYKILLPKGPAACKCAAGQWAAVSQNFEPV